MTNSEKFIGAMLCAGNRLSSNRAYLDSLNVFPVPDSDTGTNLCRTFKAACDVLKHNEAFTVNELLEKASKAMLRNARGNSGVILSSLFKGFSDRMKLFGEFSSGNLSAAFDGAVQNACRVLSRPILKGTILSVAVACRDELSGAKFSSFEEAFELLVPVSNAALKKTGEELEAAKKAGVVDSGAAGLTLIIEGIDSFLSRKKDEEAFSGNVVFRKQEALPVPDFAYCTEAIILKKGFFPVSLLEKSLEEIGDCVIVAEDGEIIKFHLHTNLPGSALSAALKFGALTDIKIDNMILQTEKNERTAKT